MIPVFFPENRLPRLTEYHINFYQGFAAPFQDDIHGGPTNAELHPLDAFEETDLDAGPVDRKRHNDVDDDDSDGGVQQTILDSVRTRLTR